MGAENALKSKPKNEEALRQEEVKKLKQKIGDLVMGIEILKEASKDRPSGLAFLGIISSW